MRPIHAHERPLVDALFERAGLTRPVDSTLVGEMDDGGMGSLAFAPLGRRLGGTVSECQFTDADGVLVCAALNLDENGFPLELDMWKVDFEPLVRWPEKAQLVRFSVETGKADGAD
jgi:hypothetical protein